MPKVKIATLATSHNRKLKTTAALASIKDQVLEEDVEVVNFLVDDGSVDGTAEAVSKIDPEIQVFNAGGDLFWAGGMRFGWENIIGKEEFDYFFFYNDDVDLNKDAISSLLEVAEFVPEVGVVVANIKSKLNGRATYGLKKILWPAFPLRYCLVEPLSNRICFGHTMNMNAVLVKSEVLSAVGFLSCSYRHSQADIEFGYRIHKSGFKVVCPPGYQGFCELNGLEGTSLERGIKLSERFSRINSLKEIPFKQNWLFNMEMYGLKGALFAFFPYAKILIKHVIDLVKAK